MVIKNALWKAFQALTIVMLVFTGGMIAQALAPLVLPFLNLTLSGDKPRAFWYLGRSSAFVAYVWLWLGMVLGLLITNKLARIWPGGATATSLHQTCSLLSLGFATFHAFILMGSRFLHYNLLEVLVPFLSSAYRPQFVAFGQISLYTLAVLVISFYVRRKITQRVWRMIHYASFGLFGLVTAHGVLTGTDTTSSWAPMLYLSCGISVAFLIIYRVTYAIALKQIAPKTAAAATAKPSVAKTTAGPVGSAVATSKPSKGQPASASSPAPAAAKGVSGAPGPAVPKTAPLPAGPNVTVVFGTQSGNAEGLAKRTVSALNKLGATAQLIDGARFNVAQLTKTERLLLITSTYGEGEPPDNIATFFKQLHVPDAPKLEKLEFGVLALGDSGYPNFAKAGRDFDARLTALGAQRAHDLVVCDTDFEQPFRSWLSALEAAYKSKVTSAAAQTPQPAVAPARAASGTPSPIGPLATAARTGISSSGAGHVREGTARAGAVAKAAFSDQTGSPVTVMMRSGMDETKYFVMPKVTQDTGQRYTDAKSFPAQILRNVRLTTDSEEGVKQIRHIVFSLLGSGVEYEPGDALGVLPENNSQTVDQLLRLTRLSGSQLVPTPDGGEVSLTEALMRHYDIVRLTTEHVRAVAERTGGAVLKHWLKPDNADHLKQIIEGRDILDLLNSHPGAFGDGRDLVSTLQKLKPRLYSISSSQRAYPSQVHLTVGTLQYTTHGKSRFGVCSGDLARATLQASRNIFVHKQRAFRLPTDPGAPVIMVGPGTGIAPFRAFLQERAITGATGKNWLFFGCCNARADFLYQDELHQMQTNGVLTRLDVAFSRDQRQKVYVQHVMQQKAEKLWRWFGEGAHFYVCGDAARMAKDVDAALHKVAQTAGGLSESDAQEWVATLKQEKRYMRDVY